MHALHEGQDMRAYMELWLESGHSVHAVKYEPKSFTFHLHTIATMGLLHTTSNGITYLRFLTLAI